MQCPKCGAINRDNAKFCHQCGFSFPIQHTSQPELVDKKARLRYRIHQLKWFIIAYIILSLCCMSSSFFLGFRTNWILWKLGLR